MIQIRAALMRASSFQELQPIVEKSEADISFWGIRYIKAGGYEGTCSLDTLTKRAVEFIDRAEDAELSEEECGAGRVVKAKIDQFYIETDSKIAEKNLLTLIFFIVCEYWIRNIQNYGYGPRFYWRSNGIFSEEMEERLKISILK